MGCECALALRGSGARVSVCGYADMGKACAFAFLSLVLEFTAECVHGAVGKDCALALLGLVLMFTSVAVQGRLHPVVAQRQFHMAQAIEQTIEVLLLQYIDKVRRLFVQDQQVPRVQAWRTQPSPTFHSFSGADVEKTVELPQLQYIDQVVDVPVVVRMPVVMQRRVPGWS